MRLTEEEIDALAHIDSFELSWTRKGKGKFDILHGDEIIMCHATIKEIAKFADELEAGTRTLI